ncbi:MAG: hypothetical protein OHK0017_00460 [Patescibacteria group bacterium]
MENWKQKQFKEFKDWVRNQWTELSPALFKPLFGSVPNPNSPGFDLQCLIRDLDNLLKQKIIDPTEYKSFLYELSELNKELKDYPAEFIPKQHKVLILKYPFLKRFAPILGVVSTDSLLDAQMHNTSNIVNVCTKLPGLACREAFLILQDSKNLQAEDIEVIQKLKNWTSLPGFPTYFPTKIDYKLLKEQLIPLLNSNKPLNYTTEIDWVQSFSTDFYRFIVSHVFKLEYQSDTDDYQNATAELSHTNSPALNQITGLNEADLLQFLNEKPTEIRNDVLTLFKEIDSLKFSNEMPASSQSFDLPHLSLNKTRFIPAFEKLLKTKCQQYFIYKVLNQPYATYDQYFKLFNEVFSLWQDAERTYLNTTENAVPIIQDLIDQIQPKLPEGVFFAGRDGIPLIQALKSLNFGNDLGSRIQYENLFKQRLIFDLEFQQEMIKIALGLPKSTSTTEVSLLLQQKDLESEREKLARQGLESLLQTEAKISDLVRWLNVSSLTIKNMENNPDKIKVYRDYVKQVAGFQLAVDTGVNGSVLKHILQYAEDTEQDVRNRILLAYSDDDKIKSVSSSRMAVRYIERLPKAIDRNLIISNNQAKAPYQSLSLQILHWASNQAINRYFLPKRESAKN